MVRMFGRQGDPDTGGDIHLIAFDIEWPRDDLGNTVRKGRCGLTLVIIPVLNNRKFVATKARQDIGFPKRCFEAGCGFPQQCIANCVAERVVDMLETVKIQQQHGERIATPALPRNSFLDLFHDREAVGEPRQDVVMSHERNALF